MRTMKMQYMLLFLSLYSTGCGGGSGTPVTRPAASYVDNQETSISSSMPGVKFKSAHDAIDWLANFYAQNGIDISSFQGQLQDLYNNGISLGHIFILARLSYVTGINPTDLLKIQEGGAGWTAVMSAFQISGLGGYANLGDFLLNNSGSGLVDRTPGTK